MPPAKTGPVLPPNLPSIPQLDEAFAKNPLTTAAEEYRRRIEWRKLRNAVVNDPDLKAALKVAENARTDLEKRKMLRAYYELYFGKMAALAATPEMKTYVDTRKKEQLSALTQPHVRPEPSAAPSPTPTPVVAPPPEPPLPDAESSASPTP